VHKHALKQRSLFGMSARPRRFGRSPLSQISRSAHLIELVASLAAVQNAALERDLTSGHSSGWSAARPVARETPAESRWLPLWLPDENPQIEAACQKFASVLL
jgi:hypothetical protein